MDDATAVIAVAEIVALDISLLSSPFTEFTIDIADESRGEVLTWCCCCCEVVPLVERVLIVDLDAHQGNGLPSVYFQPNDTEAVDDYQQNIAIFDMYNRDIYPGDRNARQYITYCYPLPISTKDKEYLTILAEELPKCIAEFQPDLIYYNAGTDIYEEDSLGRLAISSNGIIARDEIVFQLCHHTHIPVVMVLSGGYTLASANIITMSLENLHQKNLIQLSPSKN